LRGGSDASDAGTALGYDIQRMVFKFTMLNGDETVECQISGAAMDDFAGGKGILPNDRDEQFSRLRERIETLHLLLTKGRCLGAPCCISFSNISENERVGLSITERMSDYPAQQVRGPE
jgi:hypothetical protein